jgi:hypothetical protein
LLRYKKAFSSDAARFKIKEAIGYSRAETTMKNPKNEDVKASPDFHEVKANGEQVLSTEVLAWARQRFTEEEIVAGIHNIRETGGLELNEFLKELEQAAGTHE